MEPGSSTRHYRFSTEAFMRGRSRNDPAVLLYRALQTEERYPLQLAPTLGLVDDDGMPSGYISGPSLVSATVEIYRAVIGELNLSRVKQMGRIKDWRLGPDLFVDLSGAVIVPLISALGSHRGRIVQFCYRTILSTDIELPGDLWWTPYAIGRLVESNFDAENEGADFGTLVRSINSLCYMHVAYNMPRSRLPLAGRARHLTRDFLLRMVQGMLLGATLPRDPAADDDTSDAHPALKRKAPPDEAG